MCLCLNPMLDTGTRFMSEPHAHTYACFRSESSPLSLSCTQSLPLDSCSNNAPLYSDISARKPLLHTRTTAIWDHEDKFRSAARPHLVGVALGGRGTWWMGHLVGGALGGIEIFVVDHQHENIAGLFHS